jgi:hypothetical protein
MTVGLQGPGDLQYSAEQSDIYGAERPCIAWSLAFQVMVVSLSVA